MFTEPLIRRPSHSLGDTCLAAARSRHGFGCHWHPFTTVSPLRYPKGKASVTATQQKTKLEGNGDPRILENESGLNF